MDYSVVIQTMRILAPSLTQDKTDEDLNTLINLFGADICPDRWGTYWDRALAFYILHQLELSERIESGETEGIVGGKVIGRKEGDLELRYAAPSGDNTDFEDIMSQTPWGKQFLALFNLLKAGNVMLISTYATGYCGL